MDVEQLLKDLLAVPREAGLNRLRWISTHMDEEQQIDFLKGLLAKSVQSRESQNSEILFDYIDNWEELSMAAYARSVQAPFELEDAPWTPLRVPIRQAKIALITTDRQSAFDRVLASIPFKGQVLNLTSAWWFEKTKHIIPNQVLKIPDPNVTLAKKCTVFPIEFVVRGYILSLIHI